MGAVDPGGNTAHLLEDAIERGTLLVGVAPVTWSAGDYVTGVRTPRGGQAVGGTQSHVWSRAARQRRAQDRIVAATVGVTRSGSWWV